VLASLVSLPAAAQTAAPQPDTGVQPPQQQQREQRAQRFIERFNAANTTHDGRLTLEQARTANMAYTSGISMRSTRSTTAM